MTISPICRRTPVALAVAGAIGVVAWLGACQWQAGWSALAVPVRVIPPHPAPHVGQAAPDFDLSSADGTRRVRLSSFRGQRPVALVFASLTCPYFRDEAQALERLYQKYGDQVEFLMIYQREAHPAEAAQVPENAADGLAIISPKSLDDRCRTCQQAQGTLSLTMPAVVDQLNDQTAYDYMTDPVRLFLVDTSGRIAFQTAQGPWSFRAKDLEQAILASLPSIR